MKNLFNAYYPYTQLIPTDIYPVQYGEQQCEADHSFGPCMRSNYLLHYVYRGEGIFVINNTEYRPHAGQMFLITPNSSAYYKADSDNPWLYRWIEFNGSMSSEILRAAGISSDSPIYTDGGGFPVGKALIDMLRCGDARYEELMQRLWGFILALTTTSDSRSLTAAQEYIQKAESYIKVNIHKKITVTDIAGYIGIDRSYLTRLFRTHKCTSPQQYIITLKMNTAAQYLKNTDISIGEAAQSVGYSDSHVFNKAFKRQFNSSPAEWRKKQLWEQSII